MADPIQIPALPAIPSNYNWLTAIGEAAKGYMSGQWEKEDRDIQQSSMRLNILSKFLESNPDLAKNPLIAQALTENFKLLKVPVPMTTVNGQQVVDVNAIVSDKFRTQMADPSFLKTWRGLPTDVRQQWAQSAGWNVPAGIMNLPTVVDLNPGDEIHFFNTMMNISRDKTMSPDAALAQLGAITDLLKTKHGIEVPPSYLQQITSGLIDQWQLKLAEQQSKLGVNAAKVQESLAKAGQLASQGRFQDAEAEFNKVKALLYPEQVSAQKDLIEARTAQVKASMDLMRARADMIREQMKSLPKSSQTAIASYLRAIESAEMSIAKLLNADPEKYKTEIANLRQTQAEAWAQIERLQQASVTPSPGQVPSDWKKNPETGQWWHYTPSDGWKPSSTPPPGQ